MTKQEFLILSEAVQKAENEISAILDKYMAKMQEDTDEYVREMQRFQKKMLEELKK